MKEKRSLFKREELTPEQTAKRDKNRRIIRIISAVFFLVAMAGMTYLLLPLLHGIGKEGYFEKVQETITSRGTFRGLILFLALQALQVVVAIIPAIQIVGGLLYGWFIGGFLSFAGILLGTLAVWGIVKLLGAPLVEAVVSEKHLKRFSFLDDEKRLILILIILYIIPGVPKDVITYLVPLTKIKLRDFMLYVMPFRLPAIFLSSAFGFNITEGNYTAAIFVVVIIALIACAGFFFKDKVLDYLSKRHKRSRLHKSDK